MVRLWLSNLLGSNDGVNAASGHIFCVHLGVDIRAVRPWGRERRAADKNGCQSGNGDEDEGWRAHDDR